MFCPRCRDEYREGFNWCRDCDVALVESLPDEDSGPAAARAGEPEEAEGTVGGAPPDPLRTLELWLVLMIGFGSSLVTSLHHWYYGVAHGADSPDRNPVWFALLDIAGGAAPICVLLYVLSRRGLGLRQLGVTLKWSDPPLGLALLAVARLVPFALALIVMSLVRGAVPWWLFTAWRPPALSTDALSPLLVIGILCAAAREELIVRAYMMTEALALTGSAFLAVASSTAFQALYHLYQGKWWALQHALTFLVYAIFYWRTRRATPVVLAHFMDNLWLDLIRSP